MPTSDGHRLGEEHGEDREPGNAPPRTAARFRGTGVWPKTQLGELCHPVGRRRRAIGLRARYPCPMTMHAIPFARRGLLTLALAAALASLAGCINDRNSRLMVGPADGPHVLLSAFEPAPALEFGTEPVSDTPSVEGLDRSNWAMQVFLVPVDTTAHAPHYRMFVGHPTSTRRERGQFPTLMSAAEPCSAEPDRRWAEAPAGAGWAIPEAVLIPGGVVLYPPCKTRYSPAWRYERRPKRSIHEPRHTYLYTPGEIAPTVIEPGVIEPEADADVRSEGDR